MLLLKQTYNEYFYLLYNPPHFIYVIGDSRIYFQYLQYLHLNSNYFIYKLYTKSSDERNISSYIPLV